MSKKIEVFLVQHPVFTREEFYNFWDKEQKHGSRAVESLLRYHTVKGNIKRIKRGLYIALHPLDTAEKYYVNPILVASKLAPDAVLAYHTAIEFHGKAYSSYWHLYYLSKTHPRPLTLGQYHYQAVRYPAVLIDKKNKKKSDYEIETTIYQGENIRVTSLERTLVDSLDRLSISGGWEEVWRSFENVTLLKWEHVLEYCLLLENATLCAKLGFYLEQRLEELSGFEPAYLQVLEKRIPKSAHYLERIARNDKSEKWCFVKRWNLMVPQNVMTRNWDEINQ